MRNWVYVTAALLGLQAVPAHAERDPWSGAPVKPDKHRRVASPITDRFYVEGIFFNPAESSTLRIDTQSPGAGLPGTLGTLLSGEKDLGLRGRVPQGRIQIMFRLRERNRLRVDYFSSDRSGNNTINRTILFGDEVFQAGDQVTSSVVWREFTLSYMYSLVRTERLEVGLGVAAHLLDAEARGAVEARQLRQEVSGAGAFPTIPVDFTWRISRRFSFTGRANYFHASVSGFSGSVGQYHGDVQYRWKNAFTVGAGYTVMRYALNVRDADFPGSFHLNVRGPEAFFKISF